MRLPESTSHGKAAAGFTLPAVLVVVAALLILAVGILLVAGIERNTARSFGDRQRAELAARAGLEDIRGILNLEAANDDFVVLQSTLTDHVTTGSQPAPQLFIARGSVAKGAYSYRYIPLFSASSLPADNGTLAPPPVEPLVGTAASETIDFTTLPYNDKVRASWLPIRDEKNRTVARYAYWVEDLQSRVDAGTAGNTKDGGSHKRYGWKAGDSSRFAQFPAPGLNAEDSRPGSDGRDAEPPLNQVALYALDPAAGAKDESMLDNTIIDGRKALVSPDSVLAVSGIVPPLTRGADGHLVDAKSRAVEENLTASVQPYDEQALVPFANGIDNSVAGKPKLNLNSLLAKPAGSAVDEMADWIKKGLPAFEERRGGFPDNYLKTLAANAIDYADTDSEGTVSPGSTSGPGAYRGLDAYPLMSEVILHIKYNGVSTRNGRKRLLWQMILYTELWNHTNLRVGGIARISYENGMKPPAIGAGVTGTRFDDPGLMGDPVQVQPTLERIGSRYWSAAIKVDLLPNQYKFYRAAAVTYLMDVGPSSQKLQDTFEIHEELGSSGISLMWNGKEVDRSDKLVRGNSNPKKPELDYKTYVKKQSGKANIPGHGYGPFNSKTPRDYKNNMGDSRQALYLRGEAYPLSDNSYPGNVSPNRRNIRNVSIYRNALASAQALVYGRVLPSEWPDGGHDVEVSGLALDAPPVDDYDPANLEIYPDVTTAAREGDTPTFISNRGRFYSATELGRIYDPIMFTPKYDNDSDTKSLLAGSMPPGRVSWPSVEVGSAPDIYFGGGNTLRIGRPEHPEFDRPAKHAPADMPGKHAARLLDLFHAGKSRSGSKEDREGPLVRIEGHVNVNTASADAIRATVAGFLVADPRLVKRISNVHSASTMAPLVSPIQVRAPTQSKEADLLAQAIIRGRPFASPSEISSVLGSDGKLVFGNRDLLPDGNKVQWSDAAAEEVFGRVYESSTVRSRNFRVWVIGQSVSPSRPSNPSPEVLSEVRKVFTVFADPGVRKSGGSIDAAKFHLTILDENDF